MPFDLIERRKQGKLIQHKTPLSIQVKKSIYLLLSALLALIVMLSIVFLLNTSQSAQKGHVLKQEQLKKDHLLLQNRNLINKIIEARAYSRVEESDIVKDMHKPENPIFYKPEKKEE
ncbi:hypothetical protein ACFL2V_13520 [Pseudomonadota bacterium]